MVCNTCGKPASAQCRKCGRFVCSEHFIDDFGCGECFRAEMRDTEAREDTREIETEESQPSRPKNCLVRRWLLSPCFSSTAVLYILEVWICYFLAFRGWSFGAASVL